MATKLNNVPDNGHPIRSDYTAMVYAVEDVVDFAVVAGNSTDVIQVLDVPAQSIVLTAGIEVLTSDATGSLTVSLGDGSSATRFVNAQAVASTGQLTRATAYFHIYTSADTIDVTVNAANAATLKVRVWAILMPLQRLKTAQTATYAA